MACPMEGDFTSQQWASLPHGAAWVQQSLNKLGTEPPLIVDGSFGPLTVSALEGFQRAHGLDPDGKLGPLTEAALEKVLPPIIR